jgi:hypothetical protein
MFVSALVSRDSPVTKVIDYALDDRGLIPPPPASSNDLWHPVGIWGSFTSLSKDKHESYHSPPYAESEALYLQSPPTYTITIRCFGRRIPVFFFAPQLVNSICTRKHIST